MVKWGEGKAALLVSERGCTTQLAGWVAGKAKEDSHRGVTILSLLQSWKPTYFWALGDNIPGVPPQHTHALPRSV